MQANGESVHIGDAIDFEHDTENYFAFTLLPIDFFDSWERGSLLSNFAADYFKHNFPSDTAHNLISTVLNELIENAVKFSRNNSMPVQIIMKKRKNELLIRADNSLPKHRQDAFVAICRDIFKKDLDELYVERMNSNLSDSGSSGIGLILIKKDYSTGLNFSFYTDSQNSAHVEVTAKLDFHD
jgi:hypothetical protein